MNIKKKSDKLHFEVICNMLEGINREQRHQKQKSSESASNYKVPAEKKNKHNRHTSYAI